MSLRSEISSASGLALPDSDDFFAKLHSSDADEKKKRALDDSEDNDKSSPDKSSPFKTRHNNSLAIIQLSSKEVKYREETFPVVEKVTRRELKCTACGTNLKQVVELGGPVYSHPLLGTLMCKNCLSYYGEGEFSVDEDGSDSYCRWCSQGGEMFCCTDCSCVFCKACTKRNLGRSVIKEIDDSDEWKCFVCNIKPLWDLRAICWAVEEHVDDIIKAKKKQTKQNLHLLIAKRKDSPEKRSVRRELKRVKKDSSDADSSNSDIKEKKTGRNKKNDDSTSDSEGSDDSNSGSSFVRRIQVSNKPRNVRQKKKPSKQSDSEGTSSDSDFEETSRKKDRKNHSTKRSRTRNKSREAEKSSESDLETNGRRKLNTKQSSIRVSKPIPSGVVEISDLSDSDFEKRAGPKSKRPTRDSKLKSLKGVDNIISLSDVSDVEETRNKGMHHAASTKNKETKMNISISDSSDSANKKKKKTFHHSPIIRSKSEKEKRRKKATIVDTDPKESRSKVRIRMVDESNSEKSSSETDMTIASSKNKGLSSVGDAKSIQKNGTINSKRKLDYSPNSPDMPNGLDGSEMHHKKKPLETSEHNGKLSSDTEKSPDLPMELCSQGSLASDVILPTTIDEESELKARVLLQEQCLDLRILSKNLSRAVKHIQEKISTEDPAEIHKSIQKIQSLIVKTKENMDHQSSCLKDRGERWTRKVIAKARVRRTTSLSKGKNVGRTDSVDADGILQPEGHEQLSNDINLDGIEESKEEADDKVVDIGLPKKDTKSKRLNAGDEGETSNFECNDRNEKIGDKQNNRFNSEKGVPSSKDDCNLPSDQEMSKVRSRIVLTSVEKTVDSNMDTSLPDGDAENNVDQCGTLSKDAEEGKLKNGIIENGQEKINVDPSVSSQETQEYRLLLNDVGVDQAHPIAPQGSKGGVVEDDSTKMKSRNSCTDLFTDEEDEPMNLDDTVNSLDLLNDLDSVSDIDTQGIDGEKKTRKSLFSDKALKDKEALLASGSSDEEPLVEAKEKVVEKKFTTTALKDKEALLASGSSDEEPLAKVTKEEDAKKKFTKAALKDKESLLASGSSDEEPLAKSTKEDAKKKFTKAALKDKESLLASGSSDEEPLAKATKEEDAKKKFTKAALKDKESLLASGSSDEESLAVAKEKDTKNKFTTTALKDKDALLASSSSDDEPLAGVKEKPDGKAKKNKDSSEPLEDKELAESSASDEAMSSTMPEETPKKTKIGPKSRVYKSSEDDSSCSDFDISVKKRKRKTDSIRKRKKRCVDVDLQFFGDNKLTYRLTVNVIKLTEEELHEHNIHEIPSCPEGGKKRARGERRASGGSSDEVERLLNLKNIKKAGAARPRRAAARSDSSARSNGSASDGSAVEAKAKAKPAAKKKKKEDDEQKLVDYLHKNFSDDSDSSDNVEDNDSEKALKKSAHLKKKMEMQKKLAAKQLLLDELLSSSEASDGDAQTDKKKEDTKKRKREKKEDKDKAGEEKENEKVEGEASDSEGAAGGDAQDDDKPGDDHEDGDKKKNKSDEDKSDNDSSDTALRKKKKKNWRNNHLLTSKLTETDTSDEERKWSAKKKRDEKEKKEMKERKKPARKVVGSDSEDNAIIALSSTSASSDDDFVPKRKKKLEQSKKGNKDSSNSDSDKPKKKVKRRRIKAPDTDSSGSNDDVNESQKSTPGKGRKNIRKVLKEDSVGEMTRKAAKEEEDRRLRILEKQKLYNQLYDNLQEGVVKTDKLVLDFDPETKKELVSVDTDIVQKLKPHQVKGVKFMWDACFESVKRLQKSPGSGCILAHCMGLGKTFQVVTLVHTLLTNKKTKVKRVLVICPLSTVLNWVNEFKMWLKDTPEDEEIDIFELSKFKQAFERSYQLKEWHERGGVMVLSYDMFRNLSNPTQKRVRKSILETYKRTLMDPGPDLVICDEGHLLKNEKTAISKAVGKVNTLRRIALTGTPLQNNLGEYHCMVQFVKPNLLGTKKEFSNRFINPITNGQFENSTVHDVKIMKRRAHVLHKMLEGCVQRFDYSVLMPFLPPKQEYVISVRLSDTQTQIYQHYLDNFAGGVGKGQNTKLFADFQYMQRIWTHPKVLMWNVEKCERLQLNKEETDSEGSLKDFVVDDSGEDSDDGSSKSDVVNISDDETKSGGTKSGSEVEEVVKKWNSSSRSKRLAARSRKDSDVEIKEVEPAQNNPLEWWKEYTKEEDFDDLRLSGKLVLFFSILRECEKIGDKVLVFSQSMFSLDLIEHFLSLIDAETQRAKKGEEDKEGSEKLDHHRGSWARGLDYFRLDGSVSGENRSIACKMFNKEDNLRARLYLISTKAGGLGINLFAANRVIIFDASWNPSHDVQSIFRVYRFGQKKPCYIYRFLASGTMEEKIYERQVTKLSLACRVVDEQQIERHYTSHDLQEMYTFNPEPTKRPTPILPKDRLLAELLKEHDKWIETYHEHDSLLENKSEEELNEDERKAAWDDYENEKKAPTQGLLNQAQGMNNYLAYIQSLSPEAIREVLKKENPLATDEQITERVRVLMAAAYKHYEQQQTFNKQIQAYHALQNQVNFGGNAHPTALYLNNAAAMPNTKMFNQGMLGSVGASHLANVVQPQSYAYQNMINQMGGVTAKMPPPIATTAGTSGGAGVQPFLKVRNFADMQEPSRPTFKTVPTIRPLNMKAGSSRGSTSTLVKNPLFGAKKPISKSPMILGKGGATSTSGPPKSPEVETIDSD